jgi:16S rRNA (guanine(966)-N(2))-methyltransferase RsmD
LSNTIDFEEVSVLDLFGGTGNISFEFLSRGCTNVTIVELNNRLTDFIGNVSKVLKTEEHIKIIRNDVLSFIKKKDTIYDVIFADPPYDYKHYDSMIDEIFAKQLLSPDGLLIVEHDMSQDFTKRKFFSETRIYGTNRFSFFAHISEK